MINKENTVLMKLEEIKNIQDFQTFLTGQKNENFVQPNDPEYTKTICGTNLQSEILYVLPATETLENIQFYHHLKFITINNYKVDSKKIAVLKKYADKLANVTHLHIWNIKQSDLSLLSLFPNLTHLLISHLKKADFSFDSLDGVKKLNTLCLLAFNKMADLSFIPTSSQKRLKSLSITYAQNLKSLKGIDQFENLENLSLFASTMESNKKVDLEDLSGIERLTKLRSFEIGYFRFGIAEMQERLSFLKELKSFSIDNVSYENK